MTTTTTTILDTLRIDDHDREWLTMPWMRLTVRETHNKCDKKAKIQDKAILCWSSSEVTRLFEEWLVSQLLRTNACCLSSEWCLRRSCIKLVETLRTGYAGRRQGNLGLRHSCTRELLQSRLCRISCHWDRICVLWRGLLRYLCYQKTTQRHLFKQHLIKGALNYNQLPLAFEAKKMSLSHWTSFHGNEKRGSWRQGRHWEHFSWQFAVHLRLHHSFKIRIFFLLLLFFASSYFSFAFKHNLTFICIIVQKEREKEGGGCFLSRPVFFLFRVHRHQVTRVRRRTRRNMKLFERRRPQDRVKWSYWLQVWLSSQFNALSHTSFLLKLCIHLSCLHLDSAPWQSRQFIITSRLTNTKKVSPEMMTDSSQTVVFIMQLDLEANMRSAWFSN